MPKHTLMLLIITLTLLPAGCSQGSTAIPTTTPLPPLPTVTPPAIPTVIWHMRGEITELAEAGRRTQDEGTLGAILVVGEIEEDAAYSEAGMDITAQTRLARLNQDSQQEEIFFNQLQVGQQVEVQIADPAPSSETMVQAKAIEVIVLTPDADE